MKEESAYDNALRERLHRLSTSVRAPEHLHASVRAALEELSHAEARRRMRRPRWWTIPSGLAAAAVIILLVLSTAVDEPPETGSSSVASTRASTSETDPQALRRWFASRVSYEVPIPDIPDAELTGADIKEMEGMDAAAVRYRYNGASMTYMVVPASNVMDHEVGDGQGPYFLTTDAGEKVVMWGWGGTARMLMSDIDTQELMRVAEQCRKQEMQQPSAQISI